MIGVDTNILLRMVVRDDPDQLARSEAFFDARSGEDPVFVSLIVVAELFWSLTSTYKYPRDSAYEAVRRLTLASDMVIENQLLVEECLGVAASARADLADILIASGNLRQGCSHTVTLDERAAKRIPSMTLLA